MYLSRKLLQRETRNAVVEKECLAIKWAVEALKYYLLGRKFTLVTDHAPPTWMKANKEKNARVTTWFLTLHPYKFTVEHRSGIPTTNVFVTTLSFLEGSMGSQGRCHFYNTKIDLINNAATTLAFFNESFFNKSTGRPWCGEHWSGEANVVGAWP
ncbi:hypothetical protein UPYG_G00112490 [Umbra pygmaea]|uniref:Reverse transcriptase RNase H-like domain-containing protein n=1 Tax=Umbra pygmaea TaxID=75934 RepID=A0ABD0XKQ3_UMBPY